MRTYFQRLLLSLFLTLLSLSGYSQFSSSPHKEHQDRTSTTDSLSRTPKRVDSLYVGKNIFELIREGSLFGGRVTIVQSPNTRWLFDSFLQSGAEEGIDGFRIRLFFDNDRSARDKSAEIEGSLREDYPTLPVYRTYENPYFKITVGDYRTKSQATIELRQLIKEYPSAFIVKSKINFPSID